MSARRGIPDEPYGTDWRGGSVVVPRRHPVPGPQDPTETPGPGDASPMDEATELRSSDTPSSTAAPAPRAASAAPGSSDPAQRDSDHAPRDSDSAPRGTGATPLSGGGVPLVPVDPERDRRIARRRRLLIIETVLVLAISLGQSAWYSILRIIERMTRGVPLAKQTSTLNASVTPGRPWLDLGYQLSDIAFGVVPALLAIYLLATVNPPRGGVRHRLGLVGPRWGHDLGAGVVIAAAIGIPGLGLYAASRALGINTTVQASALQGAWWVIPVLILAAVMNAVLEETVMIGYLITRWLQVGWSTLTVVLASALIRGTYHLYQGWGGFLGNVVMGAVLGLIFTRTRRLLPLVVAHTVLDVVSFVGYALLAPHLSWL
ncbi:CAAX amino terminal protease self- immunity [Acidipropionibacterium jensenii]|uniref:CAAX amino terminal protease self- immunity n=2 Tax=Acidipropionibacterium jensenii TaxID=1749 RepID=A0A448P0T2_9ACTN|nr:CAAX amino terminal protease self- immunity [Acidipropionibacterium jensenii]